MENTALSSSLEDYLEAIAELTEQDGHAHSKRIAEFLQVKMPSVTNALQSLAVRDLIRYQPHQPVVLTPAGAQLAAEVRRRHAALKKFFSAVLKLEEERADDNACKIEHLIGAKALARLALLSDAILTREDCASFRNYLAETMPGIAPAPQEELESLADLPDGSRAMVVRVGENLRGHKRFADLGIVAGATVEMVGRAPFGDLLRIRLLNGSLSLRSSDAAYIRVKRI